MQKKKDLTKPTGMLTTREWSYLNVLEMIQSLLPEIGQYKSRPGNKAVQN